MTGAGTLCLLVETPAVSDCSPLGDGHPLDSANSSTLGSFALLCPSSTMGVAGQLKRLPWLPWLSTARISQDHGSQLTSTARYQPAKLVWTPAISSNLSEEEAAAAMGVSLVGQCNHKVPEWFIMGHHG